MSQELSDEDILDCRVWDELGRVLDVVATSRAVIAADRAKRVPMTHAQRVDVLAEFGAGDMWDFFDGIRAAERHHGIVGKEGGK